MGYEAGAYQLAFMIQLHTSMANTSTANQIIVETNRGPSIAGRRITIYAIMDLLKSKQDSEFIKKYLRLSDEELNAAVEYIEQHKDQVEKHYAEIVRRSEERRAHYEKVYLGRLHYAHLSLEERIKRMREDAIKGQKQNRLRCPS